MISTVAVGTDGSETAAEAVRQAADIAGRYGAKLKLLSAFPPPGGFAAYAGIELEWAATSRAEVTKILEQNETALRDDGIECETLSAEGEPADVLVRLAEECAADLLVIGNKGARRRVLASVPNSVTRKADCSVMVVKTT
jgi:nucleotide-binding universal stress UspA family protein